MIPAGLCDRCHHRRTIRSDRGSRFVLCLRSRTDPGYPRYPRLPVRACAGFVAGEDGGAGGRARATRDPPSEPTAG